MRRCDFISICLIGLYTAFSVVSCKRLASQALSTSTSLTDRVGGEQPNGSLVPRHAALAAPHLVFAEHVGCSVVENGSAKLPPGAVLCWGDTSPWSGTITEAREAMPPELVPGLSDIIEIRGSISLCARDTRGVVWCWGAQPGPFHDGREAHYVTSGVTRVQGVDHTLQLAVGMSTACAVTADGRILCWGDNTRGALGDGTNDERQGPVEVHLGFKAIGVTLDGFQACAWSAGGNVSCWGRTRADTGKFQFNRPQSAGTFENVAWLDLELGCALLRDKTVACFKGSMLDNATKGQSLPLTVVPNILDALGIAGTHEYMCILRESGRLTCRAMSERNAVPGEPRASANVSFHELENPVGVVQLAAARDRLCARLVDGSVVCWGIGTFGELGDGQGTVREQPAPIVLPIVPPSQQHSRFCRVNGDCEWDRADQPNQCFASPHSSEAIPPKGPAPSKAGACGCLDNHCTWQHPSARSAGSAACVDYFDCRYDAETQRCRSAVVGEANGPGAHVEPGPLCQCQTGTCQLVHIQPVPCKTDQDCWFSDTLPAYPTARPKSLKRHKFKPCVDGEVPPICHEICGFGFPYGC